MLFYSINLTEDTKQYTSYASCGSPVFQYNKLFQGLKKSLAYCTALMNDILSELPPDIREYIECLMDKCIFFTPDIKTHKKVLKRFLYKLKEYSMLLTINKMHTFQSKIRYMGLSLSSSDGLQPSYHLVLG